MIIFDLEWNHGYKPRLPDEILQIGAVKVDRLGGRIIDTFNAYIHPVVYKKLYHKAKELPDRDLYLASPLDFPAAYRAFLRLVRPGYRVCRVGDPGRAHPGQERGVLSPAPAHGEAGVRSAGRLLPHPGGE